MTFHYIVVPASRSSVRVACVNITSIRTINEIYRLYESTNRVSFSILSNNSNNCDEISAHRRHKTVRRSTNGSDCGGQRCHNSFQISFGQRKGIFINFFVRCERMQTPARSTQTLAQAEYAEVVFLMCVYVYFAVVHSFTGVWEERARRHHHFIQWIGSKKTDWRWRANGKEGEKKQQRPTTSQDSIEMHFTLVRTDSVSRTTEDKISAIRENGIKIHS